MRKRDKHFTLMELLVVIAIIAILFSMLMPSFRKARLQAETVVCKGSQNQLHKAQMLYAMENNRTLIPRWRGNSTWADRSWVYYKTIQLLHCPSDGRAAAQLNASGLRLNPNQSATKKILGSMSIGYNSNIGNQGGVITGSNNGNLFNAKLSKLVEPEFIPMFADANSYKVQYAPWGAKWANPQGRHSQRRANFTFIDGHSSSKPVAEAESYKWHLF